MLNVPEITNNPIKDALNVLRFFLTRRQKKNMAILAVLILISALMDVLGLASILPLIKISTDTAFIHQNEYTRIMYEITNAQSESQFIMFFVLAILVYFIFKSVFGLFVIYLQSRISTDIVMTITKYQYNKYYNMNFHRFTDMNSSQIIHQVLNIPHNFISWIFTPTLTLFSEICIIALIIIGIASYNLVLFGLIALAVTPASLSIYFGIKRKSQQLGKEIDVARPEALNAITASIMGFVDISLINKGKYYYEKFKKWQHRFYYKVIISNMINFIPMRGYEIVAILGVAVIFIYAHWFSSNTDQVLIFVGMFAAAAYRLMPSLNRTMAAIMCIEVNHISIINLYKYAEDADRRAIDTEQKEISFNNELKIEQVSFQFPNTENKVLDHIDIYIKKGETVGIIGPSGSGKTTLLNIILRFYSEQSGHLLVDGVPLSDENIISWRGKLGYVKQDIFLLDGTIAENIALGEDEIDEERMESSINQASLSDFVQEQENGWNTKIGEKGSKLSGGQRQRIGIARALYRDAEILIFDEATSALDTQTEQEVSESIAQLSNTKKTIFIVAHRITTLKNCNRIYEIKNGKIDGIHSYNELIEKVL